MHSNSIRVGGIRMRWEEQGSGEPVVFLHGIPTNPALWRFVMPQLPSLRCLAWEMVGYGRSIREGMGRDISVRRQAEYLVRWMDAVELNAAVLVGHDLGGGVAQIAAVRSPDRVRGLVLTNSICYDSWPIPSVKLLRAVGPLLARSPGAVVYLIQLVLFIRAHTDLKGVRDGLRTHWPPYADADASRALARQVGSLDVRDTLAIADRLPQLDLPAAVVWGASDQFQKMGYGERLARDLGAPLDPIDEGKHYVPEDFPERVAAAVEQVVRRLEGHRDQEDSV